MFSAKLEPYFLVYFDYININNNIYIYIKLGFFRTRLEIIRIIS